MLRGVAELKDNEEAVAVMVKYFYAFDYPEELPLGSDFDSMLEFHVVIAKVAAKYEVQDLEDLAARRFGEATHATMRNNIKPFLAFQTVFSGGATESTKALRKIATEAWILIGPDLVQQYGEYEVRECLLILPDLAAELAMHTTNLEIAQDPPEWSCRCPCGCRVASDATNLFPTKCHGLRS